MSIIEFKPVFVKTRNVRNFEVMMMALQLAEGEGRFGLVYGSAGRGKTKTAQWYAANNRSVYLRVLTIWRRSELEFLQALCRELGNRNPPHRKGRCWIELADRLTAEPRPIFIDEIEKIHRDFLDVVRDLTDITTAPVVLIGEEELKGCVEENKRSWSRTYQQMEFEPITVSDVLYYARDAARINLEPGVAKIIHKASGGDFRLVRRDMLTLVHFANAQGGPEDGNGGTPKITEEMALIAVKKGLKGDQP